MSGNALNSRIKYNKLAFIAMMWEGSKSDVMNFSPSEWMAKVNHPSDNELMLETPAFNLTNHDNLTKFLCTSLIMVHTLKIFAMIVQQKHLMSSFYSKSWKTSLTWRNHNIEHKKTVLHTKMTKFYSTYQFKFDRVFPWVNTLSCKIHWNNKEK